MDTYEISVTFERWEGDDREHGEPSQRGFVFQNENYDTEDMEALNATYRFDHTPCPRLEGRREYKPWFSTTEPRQSREYFEQGVEEFFALHVEKVNGHTPTDEDFCRLADLLGVRFEDPVASPGTNSAPGL